MLISSCNRSDKAIYQAMFPEAKTTRTIINAQDQAFLDCCIWLHFKIEKKELIPLLQNCTKIYPRLDKWDRAGKPDWWTPQKLEGEIQYYEQILDNGKRERNFYVNNSFTEVYFVDRAGH